MEFKIMTCTVFRVLCLFYSHFRSTLGLREEIITIGVEREEIITNGLEREEIITNGLEREEIITAFPLLLNCFLSVIV